MENSLELVETLTLVAHVAIAVAIVALVLLQQGKGADMGASLGGGASQTVFGSSGSGNFLTRTTSFFAVLFFVSSFTLAVFAKQNADEARGQGIPSAEIIEQQQQAREAEAAARAAAQEDGGLELPADEEASSPPAEVVPQGDAVINESNGPVNAD